MHSSHHHTKFQTKGHQWQGVTTTPAPIGVWVRAKSFGLLRSKQPQIDLMGKKQNFNNGVVKI